MIYDKIKALAEKKGISIYRVEIEAGLSKCSISKWNNSSPSAESLYAVSKVLNVDINDLLEGIDSFADDEEGR